MYLIPLNVLLVLNIWVHAQLRLATLTGILITRVDWPLDNALVLFMSVKVNVDALPFMIISLLHSVFGDEQTSGE